MDRPRRTTRQTTRQPVQASATATSSSLAVRKPVLPPFDPEKQLKILLESSKSDLVSVDMSDIINAQTWDMLSDESKDCLKTLLPATAFLHYEEIISTCHPVFDILNGIAETIPENAMQTDAPSINLGDLNGSCALDPSINPRIFNDSHFLAAMRTFQDQLYLNWFSPPHQEKLRQFRDGITNGTLSAPWKDEVWERDNKTSPTESSVVIHGAVSLSQGPLSSARAGGAAEIKLATLAKNGVVRIGDILSYRRSFASSLIIEKDCLIESITSDGITLLTTTGTTRSLPLYLVSDPPGSPPSAIHQDLQPRRANISSPSMLENLLLDIDERLEKSKRPNGNAWKCISVWRWPKTGFEEGSSADASQRGGRENHGTLFYLRGSFYNEQ